jgi:hypothetical protein
MAENLTQCSVCRTLIPPEKAAGMQPPLLCEGCRARQATAHSSEFPFSSFVRFRSATRALAVALMAVAVIQFAMLFWTPLYEGIYGLSRTAILMRMLPSLLLWNILFPVLLLILRKALLAFSDMMSDLFVAAYKDKL